MSMNNYDLVKYVIESYDDKDVLSDFKSRFVEGENISKDDYLNFCYEYISDCGDGYYIDLNWKYIISGGDESVFNEVG